MLELHGCVLLHLGVVRREEKENRVGWTQGELSDVRGKASD